jgi:alpha-glutamyl/putrescinyl thymine pyrophosphorylase-like protein
MSTTCTSTSELTCIPGRRTELRPRDKVRASKLEAKLRAFDGSTRALPGIRNDKRRESFLEQLVESVRRIEFVSFLRDEKFDAGRADPSKDIFDPLRAAVYWARKGKLDEAFWLVFLFVHFGKHQKDGWRLARDVYGALGGTPWTWERVSKNPDAFVSWLAANQGKLNGRFGNHRKYESLNANSPKGTAAVVKSYVNWVGPSRSHWDLIRQAHKEVGQEPGETFDWLYRSMKQVQRFGRLGIFDYLTMLGKLGLAPIEPPSAYLSGATGPLKGARLLFANDPKARLSAKTLDDYLRELNGQLGVGMQALEDSLCNWQKSPNKFTPFLG